MSASLLSELFRRGNEVSLECGRLKIVPKSGKKIPSEWLTIHYWPLIEEILVATGRKGYRYDRFTRSSGGYGGGKYPGITLHYIDMQSGEEVYLMFNAEVTKPGSNQLRSGKSFLPPERGEFIKYWKRVVGALPQGRRSKCCESMSRFKPIVVDLAPDRKGKARNKTAMALEISTDQISACLSDEIRTDYGPDSDQARTNVTIHGAARELGLPELEALSTTGATNYELSYQDSALTRQKSNEEWLRDYGDGQST